MSDLSGVFVFRIDGEMNGAVQRLQWSEKKSICRSKWSNFISKVLWDWYLLYNYYNVWQKRIQEIAGSICFFLLNPALTENACCIWNYMISKGNQNRWEGQEKKVEAQFRYSPRGRDKRIYIIYNIWKHAPLSYKISSSRVRFWYPNMVTTNPRILEQDTKQ